MKKKRETERVEESVLSLLTTLSLYDVLIYMEKTLETQCFRAIEISAQQPTALIQSWFSVKH